MSATLAPVARQLFLNPSNGAPASGFKLFTYEAGTTTKLATYTNASGNTPNTNPIILDTLGECDLWLSAASYKLVFAYPTDTDPPTNPIWSRDNIQAPPGAGRSSRAISGNTTVLSSDSIIEVDASAGPVTVTYPLDLGSSNQAQVVTIVKIDDSNNLVQIIDDGSATLRYAMAEPANGAQMQSCDIYSNGTALRVLTQ